MQKERGSKIMTSLLDEKRKLVTGIGSHRHPVFDCDRLSKLENWWDDALAALEMSKLEECAASK